MKSLNMNAYSIIDKPDFDEAEKHVLNEEHRQSGRYDSFCRLSAHHAVSCIVTKGVQVLEGGF